MDVDAIYAEWLDRAYGPGAASMRKVYDLLDDRLLAHKRKESIVYRGSMYEMNKALIEAVHLPIFADMERLYLRAFSLAKTDAQRKRLKMFGDNLILLHGNLRRAGMLKNPRASTFYLTDAAFEQFKREVTEAFWIHIKVEPVWDGEYRGQ